METQTFWIAFSAISTFLAVLVALGIAIYQYRKDRKVELKVTLATKGRFSEEKSSIIVISNVGHMPETCTRLIISYSNGEKKEVRN